MFFSKRRNDQEAKTLCVCVAMNPACSFQTRRACSCRISHYAFRFNIRKTSKGYRRELSVMYGYQTSFCSLVCDRSIPRFGAHGQGFLCKKHYTDDSLAMGGHV